LTLAGAGSGFAVAVGGSGFADGGNVAGKVGAAGLLAAGGAGAGDDGSGVAVAVLAGGAGFAGGAVADGSVFGGVLAGGQFAICPCEEEGLAAGDGWFGVIGGGLAGGGDEPAGNPAAGEELAGEAPALSLGGGVSVELLVGGCPNPAVDAVDCLGCDCVQFTNVWPV
jgi:hypothetical protein